MYRDIEQIIQHDSHKYITSEGGDNLSNQKLTSCEIRYDQFFCSVCTEFFFKEIKKKISALKKLYNLVKALNIQDDNEKKIVLFQLISSEN